MKKINWMAVIIGGMVLALIALLFNKKSSVGQYQYMPTASGSGSYSNTTVGKIGGILTDLSGIFSNVYGTIKSYDNGGVDGIGMTSATGNENAYEENPMGNMDSFIA